MKLIVTENLAVEIEGDGIAEGVDHRAAQADGKAEAGVFLQGLFAAQQPGEEPQQQGVKDGWDQPDRRGGCDAEDDDLIEKLVTPLTEEADIAVSYARQIPREDSGAIEYISRIFNYPMESRIKSEQDMDELGIKTYFCSNVCAAYRRDIYDKLGGFIERAIFNEDMIYAAGAVKAGYRIAYAAAAEIYHSHDYDCGQQFRRNFDIGVSQAEHPEVFAGIRSEKEGGKYVKETVYVLKEAREFGLIPYFYLQCACRYAGYLLGKHYKRLPKGLILKCTSNKEYWSKSDNGGEVQPD